MRGTIIRRGKSWRLKYDLSRENGVRRQRYKTVQGTFKDAQRELTKLLNSADDGTNTAVSCSTTSCCCCCCCVGGADDSATIEFISRNSKRTIMIYIYV